MKTIAVGLLLLMIGAGGAYTTLYLKRRGTAPSQTVKACVTHEVKACPFCDRSQVAALGDCKAHKVPEALCHRCRPELIAVFKTEGDWCAGHEVPESQCQPCGGSVSADGTSLCGRHEIASASCPFCDKSLVETMGMCGGHEVPEALCSRCNPALIPGFKAEGDWCEPHQLPESQCKRCGAGR